MSCLLRARVPLPVHKRVVASGVADSEPRRQARRNCVCLAGGDRAGESGHARMTTQSGGRGSGSVGGSGGVSGGASGLPMEVNLGLRCAFCGQGCFGNGLDGSGQCGNCRMVWYCSEEHQQHHWKRHKPDCRRWRAERDAKEEAARREAEAAATLESLGRKHAYKRPCQPPLQPRTEPLAKRTAPAYVDQHVPIQPTLDPALLPLAWTSPSLAPSFANADPAGPSAAPSTAPTPPAVQHPPTTSLCHHKHQCKKSETKAPKAPIQKKDHTANRPYGVTLQQHLKAQLALNPTSSLYDAFCARVHEIAAHMTRGLKEYGWAAVDNFLGDAHGECILKEVKDLYASREFVGGQLMKARHGAKPGMTSENRDVRSDFVYWFDNADATSEAAVNINFLISMIDSVVVQLASGLPGCEVNGRSRAMVAVYPGKGTRYVKHVDNPVEDGRVLTTIYYLNHNWQSHNGGELRVFPTSADDANPFVDIQPLFDRLFMFWSDKRNPHEVLPVWSHRYAVTLWYFDESEKKRAMERVAARELQKQATRPTRPKQDHRI